jgi:HEAT repeat protein
MRLHLRPAGRLYIFHLLLALLVSSASSQQPDWVVQAKADLKSPDSAVRKKALSTLSSQSADISLEPLMSALTDEEPEIRRAASCALGYLKDKRAVPQMLPLIFDKIWEVRRDTYWALGQIGDSLAVEPLLDALGKTNNFSEQVYIIQALGGIDDPRSVMPLFELKPELREYGLKALGSSAVEPMCDILKHGKLSDHYYAMTVLERVADDRATETLISVLGESMGRSAANTLAWRIGASAFEPLVGQMSNRNPIVRENAVWALAELDFQRKSGNEEVLVVADVLQEPVSQYTYPTSYYPNSNDFSPIPTDVRVISVLLNALKDESGRVRSAALKCLANVHRDDVFEAIVKAMSDAELSEEASLMVGFRKDARAVPFLVPVLRKGNIRAAMTLAKIGSLAVEGLISILGDKSNDLPRREYDALEQERHALFRCGNEPPRPNYDVRVHAAWALGDIGDERARKPLTAALKDRAPWLREAAAEALANLDKKVQAPAK